MSGEIYAIKNTCAILASILLPTRDKYCRADTACEVWKIEQRTTSSNVRPAQKNDNADFPAEENGIASICRMLPLIGYFLPSIGWSWCSCSFLIFFAGDKNKDTEIDQGLILANHYLKSRIMSTAFFHFRRRIHFN
jgi:hypothetical protein